MKKGILFTIVALFLTSYYSYIIFEARESTPQIIQTAKLQIVEPVSQEDFSKDQIKKLLEVQDPNFFHHGGTDFLNGRITTITQSLSKFLYFEEFQPGLAKIQQSLLARFALNPLVSKEQQLYLFLNLTYFGEYKGHSIRGFGQASKLYFGKTIKALTEQEYSQLLDKLFTPNN